RHFQTGASTSQNLGRLVLPESKTLPREPFCRIVVAFDNIMARRTSTKPKYGGELGFEAQLWAAADKLRSNMDAAEYKHVVLGLIFLKYISDSFEERHGALIADAGGGADPEDPDEYRAENIFWVPSEARWSHLQNNAKQPTI